MSPANIFTPIKQHKGTLYENVARQIEALITNESITPGYKLPPERELADIFGVSRTCIREAVKSLSARGFLSIEHGRGVFVREFTRASDADVESILKQILWTSPEDMKSLFEMRKLLEPQGACWATQRATDQEIIDICKIVENIPELGSAEPVNFIRAWEIDTKFHMAIAHAGKNQVFVRIMNSMLDLMADARKQTLQVSHRLIKSAHEHCLICDALKKRDCQAASYYMLLHIENVEKELLGLES